MSFSEKLAAKRALKEQRAAEKQLIQAGESGESLVRKIGAIRQPLNLEAIESSASVFDPNSENAHKIDELLRKPKERAMYAMVREHLTGDWMGDFRKLLAVLSRIQIMQGQSLSWDDWRAAADKAGLDEKQLTQALQVVFVFQKAELKRASGAKR